MLVDRLQMKPREASVEAGQRLYVLPLQRNFTRGRRTNQACAGFVCSRVSCVACAECKRFGRTFAHAHTHTRNTPWQTSQEQTQAWRLGSACMCWPCSATSREAAARTRHAQGLSVVT